jgi:hypothetical protein
MVQLFTSTDDFQVELPHINHENGPFTITSANPASAEPIQNHRTFRFRLFKHFNTGYIFGLYDMNLVLFIDNVFNFTRETEIILNFLKIKAQSA